jgi:hypothetical protein
VRESLDHRERAYAGYLGATRYGEAAIVAIDHQRVPVVEPGHTRLPPRGGSLAPAGRFEAGRDDRLDGWLWLMEGYTCDEPPRQRTLLTQALELARRWATLTWNWLALSDLGLVLVIQVRCAHGLKLLDEAMAGTSVANASGSTPSSGRAAACSPPAVWLAISGAGRSGVGRPIGSPTSTGVHFFRRGCRSHYGRSWWLWANGIEPSSSSTRPWPCPADGGREPRVEALAGLAELRAPGGAGGGGRCLAG